jgi:hypothetical protein
MSSRQTKQFERRNKEGHVQRDVKHDTSTMCSPGKLVFELSVQPTRRTVADIKVKKTIRLTEEGQNKIISNPGKEANRGHKTKDENIIRCSRLNR